MTDQNNRQSKPNFSKGDVVFYVGSGIVSTDTPMIVLDYYICKRINTYILLSGDKTLDLYEQVLSSIPLTQIQKFALKAF